MDFPESLESQTMIALRKLLVDCYQRGSVFSWKGKDYVLTEEVYHNLRSLIACRAALDAYRMNLKLDVPYSEEVFNIFHITPDLSVKLHEWAIWKIAQFKKQGFNV